MTFSSPNDFARRPRQLHRQPQRRNGDSRRAAWSTEEDEKPPPGEELKAPFGELVVTGRRQMAARADCGRTLSRSHGCFDALFVRTEVGDSTDAVGAALAQRLKGLNITTDLMQVGKIVTGQQLHDHGQGLRATLIVLPAAFEVLR